MQATSLVAKGLSGGFDFANRGVLNKSTNRTTTSTSVVLVSRQSLLRSRFSSFSMKSTSSSDSLFRTSAKSRLVKAQASGLISILFCHLEDYYDSQL